MWPRKRRGGDASLVGLPKEGALTGVGVAKLTSLDKSREAIHVIDASVYGLE